MSDCSLRMYCFEQARLALGGAPLHQILEAAAEIYAFLTDGPEQEPTMH